MSCDFLTLAPGLCDSALVCSLPSVTHLRPSGVYSGFPGDSLCKRRVQIDMALSVGCGARVFVAKSDSFCALQACMDGSRQPLCQSAVDITACSLTKN